MKVEDVRGVPLQSPLLLGLLQLEADRHRLERDGRKNCPLNLSWCGWVFLIELSQSLWCMDICSVFPGIVFYSVSFPFDEEMQLTTEHFAVENLFHQVLLFSFHKFWWGQKFRVMAHDWIVWYGSKFYHIEHWGLATEGSRHSGRLAFLSDMGLACDGRASEIVGWEVFTVPHVFCAECAEFCGVRMDPRGILTSQLPIICCATIRMDPHISRRLHGNRPSASEHGNSDCKNHLRQSVCISTTTIPSRLPRHAIT